MQTYFYHSPGGKDDKGAEVNPDEINERILQHAITIHPLKQSQNMEKLMLRLSSIKRRNLKSNSQRALVTVSKLSQAGAGGEEPPLPSPDLLDSLALLSGP